MAEAQAEKSLEKPAEKERNFLGLTHNPFVEPHRGFFERGGRKTYLEQLRHLSEWSRRVLLVTGAEGVGKTTLYRQLAATLEPRVKAARINGSLVNTGFEVLSATAQGFGLAIPTGANTQSLRMDLIAHVEEQTAGDRLCLALVDDAHLLDNKALESLIALAHESGLHLVFFGEVRMVPLIERAASARGVGWQEIRLTGYGEADARDYLEWRFSQAKYRGRIPFTDNEVKDLVKLSGGLPGRINQMANVLLVKLETGEGRPPRRGFPRVHAALLTLLVVMIGLLYLLVGDAGSEPELEMAEADPAGVEPAAAAADEQQTQTQTQTSEDETPVGDEPASGEELLAAAVHDPEADFTPSSEPLQPVAEQTPTIESPVDEAVATTSAQAVEPVVQESAAPAQDADSESGPVTEQSEEPVLVAETSVEPLEVADGPLEAAAEPVPGSVAASTPGLPGGVKDTRWLLEQDPDYFTLQLVTVSAAESASAFVRRQGEPGEFTIYQLQRDGRVLHVVLYGLFSSRDAAERAADNLPAEVGQVQPWIRSVGQVQDAARLATRQ